MLIRKISTKTTEKDLRLEDPFSNADNNPYVN